MPVLATQKTTGGTATDGSSFDTASFTKDANTVTLVAVGLDNGGGAAPTTTIAGLGFTWTEVRNKLTPGGTRRITLFRAMAETAATGAITITHSGTAQSTNWSVTQFSNVDLTGTNGANAIVQSADASSDAATTLTVTLAAFGSTDNATYGAIQKNGTEVITPGADFTELGENNAEGTIQAQWRDVNDTSVDWSWASNHAIAGVGVELKFSTEIPGRNQSTAYFI